MAGITVLALAAGVGGGIGALRVPAQVLARPGWVGSGVAPAAWWRRAVFYRVKPAQFQDADGDGVGDLRGMAARLDYVQSLGVDAIVLDDLPKTPMGRTDGQDGAGIPADGPDALGDLIREASRHQLRVLLTVTPAMQGGDGAALLQTVREWMNEGAAGVFLPQAPPMGAAGEAAYADLATALRSLLRGFPGDRVLLVELPPLGATSDAPLRTLGQRGANPAIRSHREAGGVLTLTAALPVEPPRAATLQESLRALASGAPGASRSSEASRSPEASLLLHFAEDPQTGSPNAAAAAAVLLGLRGAAIVSFGDEIGLNTSPDAPRDYPMGSEGKAKGTSPPVMQWTPANVQQAPIERRSEYLDAAPGREGTQFGAYRPYVHPPPGSLTGPVPVPPRVAVDGNLPVTLPDANTLPGFTTGALPNEPVEGGRLNVTTEDRDPQSLLNAYRQLIALHHDHPTIREGILTPLPAAAGAADVVAWVRRAPAGSRTAADVLAVVNLGTTPVTLSLDRELAAVGLRTGRLRTLFTWSREPLTGESTGVLRLPPHGVFLGELIPARRGRR